MKWPDAEWKDRLIPIAVCLPLFARVYLLPAGRVGNDTQTHIYKVQLLTQQFLSDGFPGLYDWSWYAGNEFLQLYPPLFYLSSSVLSLLGFSASQAAVLTVTGSFALGAVFMYRTILLLTDRRGGALLATTVFVYFPTHIASYFLAGGLPRVLAIGIAPVAVYYMSLHLENGTYRSFVLWVFSGTAVVASNHGVGFIIILGMCLYVLSTRRVVLPLTYGFLTTLLVLPILVPYTTYRVANDLPVFAPDIPLRAAAAAAIAHPAGIGISIAVLFIGFTSIVFLSGNLTRYFTAASLVVGSILLYNVAAYLLRIPLLQLAAFMRSTPALVVFASISLGLAAARLKLDTRRVILGACCLVIIVEAMFVPYWVPQQQEKYDQAIDSIQADSDEWSRWAFLPRIPVGASATDEVEKPYISGWYVQSAQRALYEELGSTVHPNLVELEDDVITETNDSLAQLEYLGVEYVVVEKAEPTLRPRRSSGIHRALDGHPRLTRLTRYQSVSAYRVRNFTRMETYESNPTTDEEYLHNETDPATVYSFTQSGGSTEIVFETDGERWIVVPIADTTSLTYTLDGKSVNPAPAYAGMVKIKVGRGVHSFRATPMLPPRTAGAIVVSALIALVLSLLWRDETRHQLREHIEPVSELIPQQ